MTSPACIFVLDTTKMSDLTSGTPTIEQLLEEYRLLGIDPIPVLQKDLARLRSLERQRQGPYYRFLAYLQDHHAPWEVNYWGDHVAGNSFSVTRKPEKDALEKILYKAQQRCWHSSSLPSEDRYSYYFSAHRISSLELHRELIKAARLLYQDRTGKVSSINENTERFQSWDA